MHFAVMILEAFVIIFFLLLWKEILFIFLLQLRVGMKAGLGNPSPLKAGFGVNFLPPTSSEAGAGLGTVKRGRAGMLKLVPVLPRCHVYI